jgi:ribosomal protein L37AE/L43A
MKPNYSLKKLKELSKRYARAQQVPLHKGRDTVAVALGFSHWNEVTKAHKGGWNPTQTEVMRIENLLVDLLPGDDAGRPEHGSFIKASILEADVQYGKIDEHDYQISVSLGDVDMYGTGWHLHVPEAPNKAPRLEIAKHFVHEAPVYEAQFQSRALQVALKRADQVRAGVASDWPRRSTKPDKDGLVRHPISGVDSDKWYCLHCDLSMTGKQIAKSLWHCPSCDASPLDIHENAWWLEDGDAGSKPIADKEIQERPELVIDIADTRLKLELHPEKITLLIRSALVEDATNASERLGALFADINVHEDNDVWITFDEYLWPGHKEPVSALAVAALLGISVEQETCFRELPFAWPGLGEHTSSTVEYTKMMLKAYGSQQADKSFE